MAERNGKGCDFEREYGLACAPVLVAIDRAVRCADYGGTSWTTREQALAAAAALRLAPGRKLLEVGGGAGWPSLLMAQATGCSLVLTDPNATGLRAARERALRDGLGARCDFIVADGAAQPFAPHSFDAIHHADVLCCMTAKRQLLRECRRVARDGAPMAFSVIWLSRAPADTAERELLQRSGPPYPEVEADYAQLLSDTGWRVEDRSDVTGEFLRSMEVLLRESQARHTGLVELLGAAEVEAQLARRRSTCAAVSSGLLRRECFVVR